MKTLSASKRPRRPDSPLFDPRSRITIREIASDRLEIDSGDRKKIVAKLATRTQGEGIFAMSTAGFSLDEFFDPILRQAADGFEPSVPFLLRGAYRKLVDSLIAISIDEAAKSLFERLIAEYLPTDRSQPFTGFALSRLTKADAQALEAASIDPLTILTLIGFAIQVVEWFRNRPRAALTASEGPGFVDSDLVSSLLLAPESDLTLTLGEGLKIVQDATPGTDAPVEESA